MAADKIMMNYMNIRADTRQRRLLRQDAAGNDRRATPLPALAMLPIPELRRLVAAMVD